MDNPDLVADCAALLVIKTTLAGADGNLNWSSDIRISDWNGILIDDNRVAQLRLAEYRLNGAIPSALSNLSMLDTLDLSDNRLTGAIPSELGNLSMLDTLDL